MTTGPDGEQRPVEPTFADVMNGFSFDSGRSAKRRRWGRRRAADEDEAGGVEETAGEGSVDDHADAATVDSTGDHAGGPRWQDEQEASSTDPYADRYPRHRPQPPPPGFGPRQSRGYEGNQPPGGWETGPKHRDNSPPEPEISTSAAVRPYAWTRGRTRSGMDLQIETLVSTSGRGRDELAMLPFEHRSVAELCERAQSVAEVAALLAVPLGVAKVLLGDMAGLGLVVVHQAGSSNGDVPDLALMERVLSGLRRL